MSPSDRMVCGHASTHGSLMQSVYSLLARIGVTGRDGSSPHNAVVVGSVAEAYAWLQRHFAGWEPSLPVFEQIDGRDYDVFLLRSLDDPDDALRIYFNVSSCAPT